MKTDMENVATNALKDITDQAIETIQMTDTITELAEKVKQQKVEIANLKEGMKFAGNYIAELTVGAQSALNGMVYFKGKWEDEIRKPLMGKTQKEIWG